jgi:hypothetical protein
LFFTLPDDTGLSYGFFQADVSTPGLDPRVAPGWTIPPISAGDPLGIERCSHHTILTDRPERGLELHVDALGGEVIHQGRNEFLGATSTYVHLSGSTVEFAVPDDGTAAHEDWTKNAPNDTYHAITWVVTDLVAARQHLEAQGVGILSWSDDTFVTDPVTSLGVPWGFSTVLPPGDPRR